MSPAGSDTQVRRIMRRKDSGSVGDDDGSSVKSVESVGNEEKKVSAEIQINKPRDLRKTSSSDLQEEGKSQSIQKNEDEKTVHPEKEKIERKSSATKDAKEIVEKPKNAKDLSRTESQLKNREEGKEAGKVPTAGGRDIKKQVEDSGKRPERKSSESRPRNDEALRKKSQSEESRNRNDYESKKENLERGGNRLGSKSERGSSESLRSRDSTEKRKEDRRRPEDIKRKREDFERNDAPLNERGNHAPSRGRGLYSGRGRGTLGGKSYLRGHPKSYSNARTDRTAPQRRLRNDSKDYTVTNDIKTVAAEEKGQVNERIEERLWADGDRRQGEGNKRQPYSERRQRDDKRPHDDKQHFKTEKTRRDGDKRYGEGEKREREEDKQQTGERRRNEYQDSRSYDNKRNERGTRDTRDDRSYKGSVRNQSKAPTDRAERFRDKSKNKGGFGVPPPKEQPKKSDNEEKSKDETSVVKTKSLPPTTESKKSNDIETTSLNKERTNEGSFVPPTTEDWDVESKNATKDIKKESAAAPVQKIATETKTEKPAATKDASADKKVSEKVEQEKPSTLVTDGKKQQGNKESKASSTIPSKGTVHESKSGESRDRIVPNKDSREQNKIRNPSKSDSGDIKTEKKHETESYGENRRKQDSKFDDRRNRSREETRREPKRNDDRKASVRSSNENWDKEIDSTSKVRKEPVGTQSGFDERRVQRENRDGYGQSDKTQDRGGRYDNTSKVVVRKDRRDQRDKDRPDYRNRNERNDQRERTDRHDVTDQRDRPDRTDQRERVDRRDRTEQRERPGRRDRSGQFVQTNQRDKPMPVGREKVESNENRPEKPRKPNVKENEQSKDIHQNESLPEKQDAKKISERNEKQDENLNTMKRQPERFTMGTVSPASDRRRLPSYNDSRRGYPSSRRGNRGGLRGRGRGLSSGKPLGKLSTTSKDDDDNDSDDYHSAYSSVDSDESDSEDNDRRKDYRGQSRSYSSSSRSRGGYSSRGRGRGGSHLNRSPRKPAETPPRFQRQAKSTGRGRGKGSRGGFSSRENWNDNVSKNKDGRNSDEGPSPKKRPPDISYSKEKDSDGSSRGRKTIRGGHSGNKSSFLAKKQQEAVEGSSRKGGGRFGAKSTIPAALTTQGRRAKNEPAPADGEENLEPPKKNPRRTEPQKVGIDHIDLSNIAGFIDIDDIVQPANEFEPASPQSDFVEVKSKRMQKEQRERAREEEERKRREIDKMMQDAMAKPKTNKSGSQNKQHTSKPPRFSRNSGLPANMVSNLSGGNTSPRGVTPVASPENGAITALSSTNVDQKRASPLMLEKPSSPAPPPMFNAWTKPLSITPAKPPGEASVELSRIIQPDPLAVGSGKPQRASGAQLKAEEPELQIQLTLPDTFQAILGERDIDSQSSESRMFSRVNESDVGESRGAMKKTSDENAVEKIDGKQADVVQSVRPNAHKEERKLNTQNVKSSEPSDKYSEHDKRQPTGNNWKSGRAPRFEKNVSGKRNTDGKKTKSDNNIKDINGEAKSQSDMDKLKEVKLLTCNSLFKHYFRQY